MEFGPVGRHHDPHLRAVILDWLGTTVDFGCCAPGAALVELFKAEGVELAAAETRNSPGLSTREQLRVLLQHPDVAARWRKAHRRHCEEADVELLLHKFLAALAAVAGRFGEPIPGVVDAVRAMRARHLAIGSTTEFDAPVVAAIAEVAAQRGYAPDCVVHASEVSEGRPAPWMCFECARRLNLYPMEVMVKVDDTVEGIQEGRNAGTWAVGVAATGRDLGLTPAEGLSLSRADYANRLKDARARLRAAGAHYVIDSLGEILPCLDAIERQRAGGVKP